MAPELPSSKRGNDDEPQDEIMESPTEASYFRAYPNPFNQQVTIAYNLKDDCLTGCFIRLADIRGRIVIEQPIWSMKQTVDISHLGTGLYLVRIDTAHGEVLYNGKLVLTR